MASFQLICDTCHEVTEGSQPPPWECPGCGQEVCEHCFWSYAHCKKCCEGKTDTELIAAATDAGFEFENDI